MHVEFAAAVGVGDERAEFRVLDRDLPEAHVVVLMRRHREERFEHAVVADARGVRDVAEERRVEIVVRRLKHRRDQRFAEAFAFAVDVRVVRTREVDALEDAAAAFHGFQAVQDLHAAVRTRDHRLARRDLHDFGRGAVERRLDRGAFARRRKHLVVKIKISGTYRMGVPDRKSIARAVEAAERERAVKAVQCLPQDLRPVRRTGVKIGVLFQIVRDDLENQVAVRLALRMMAQP